MNKQMRLIPNLATKIAAFFDTVDDTHAPSVLRTIEDFIKAECNLPGKIDLPDDINLNEILTIVDKLTQAGILIYGGTSAGQPFLGKYYITNKTNTVWSSYGTYEFIVGGQLEIFNHFKDSILPIVVTGHNEDQDIGTGFFLGNSVTMITCKHVIENKKSIRIANSSGVPASPLEIFFPNDPRLDIALLHMPSEHFNYVNPFRMGDPKIGDTILSIGYPPIPGFDALQVLEHGEISTSIKTAAGQVVAKGDCYIDQLEYYLINARVKGGSSGAPVIDTKGFVVGMVSNTAISSDQSDQIKGMGYGIVTPKKSILSLLEDSDTKKDNANISVSFNILKNGCFQTDL